MESFGFGFDLGVAGSDTSGSSASSLAALLAAGETQALSLDFTDDFWNTSTSRYGSAYVLDTGTPANNYNSIPGSLLTYTSPSVKMCMQADGVLQYGPHNLFTYSSQLDNAAWTKDESTISANAAVAPDGTTTADKILETVVNDGHGTYQVMTVLALTPYRFTAILKAGEVTTAAIRVYAAANDWILSVVNLSDGSATQYSAGGSSSFASVSRSVVDLGSGWYKIHMVFTTGTGITTIYPVIDLCNATTFSPAAADGECRYAGNAANGIYSAGAQLARYPAVDTYIATTSAAKYELPYEWDSSGNPLGIRAEEARTNIVLYNNTSFTGWTTTGVTTSAVTGPDGVSGSAIRLTEAATTNVHRLYSAGLTFTNVAWTMSAYLKGTNWAQVYVQISGSNFALNVNLQTGATGYSTGLTSSTVEDCGNGWYRACMTFTGVNASGALMRVHCLDSDRTTLDEAYLGSVSRYVDLYCPQAEIGAFVTSPIATTSATVTRAADNISLATSAFPSLLTSATIYAKWYEKAGTGLFSCHGGNDQNRIDYRIGNQSIISSGGVNYANLGTAAATANAVNKVAVAATSNDFACVLNAAAAVTDGAGSMPVTLTTLQLGGIDGTAANNMTGWLQQIMAIPRRMTNADMQTLTT